MNLMKEARVLRGRIKGREERIRRMKRELLARSTPEVVLPESSTKATVAPSANTVEDAFFEALITPKALLSYALIDSWNPIVVRV